MTGDGVEAGGKGGRRSSALCRWRRGGRAAAKPMSVGRPLGAWLGTPGIASSVRAAVLVSRCSRRGRFKVQLLYNVRALVTYDNLLLGPPIFNQLGSPTRVT